MSYFEQTIKEVLTEIEDGKLYLPAIQRKFVWSENQITKLFDSLMRGYPIGTFLFWQIDKEKDNINGYVFYDFIKDYHERDFNQNPIRDTIIKQQFKVALDGQQRLTSLYISLMGSLANKEPRKYWRNDDAFPKKELYLNVSNSVSEEDEDDVFEFQFLDPKNLPKNAKTWFRVKEVLGYSNGTDLMLQKGKDNWSDKEIKMAISLWEVICFNKYVSYFSIGDANLDQVLDIFVRVNSAGTVLSKSDLIFSTLTAKWFGGRELIDTLIKNINRTTRKFAFNTDFVMRTILYLSDLSINLKVESFKENVETIQKNYKKIENAIKKMVKLIEEYGFSDENITSYNALIPIVYFIYKSGDLKSSKSELIKYFIIAQIKNLFGVASNSALSETRKSLVVDTKSYELKNKVYNVSQFYSINLTGDRNFKFGDEELERVFDYSKGKYTFMILSLLYPEVKISEVEFHQDHMHPAVGFKEKNLIKNGFSKDDTKEIIHKSNQLANLQLLEGRENESKNKTPLEDWIGKGNSDKYLPTDQPLKLIDFRTFYEARKKLMKEQLRKVFGLV